MSDPSTPEHSRPPDGRGILIAVTLAGLIPFLGLAVLVALAVEPVSLIRASLLTYGAVIVSYMAGTQWGLSLPRQAQEPKQVGVASLRPARAAADRGAGGVAALAALSTVPALLGWAAIVLLPWMGLGFAWAYLALSLLLVAQLAVDGLIARAAGLPRWYRRVRLVAAPVAALALALAALSLAG